MPPSALALHVAEAFDPALAAQFRRSVATRSSATRSLGVGILGFATGNAAAETGRHAASAPAEPSLANVSNALSKSGQSEAQDLEGFDADSVRPIISKLHNGSHGGPFLAVETVHLMCVDAPLRRGIIPSAAPGIWSSAYVCPACRLPTAGFAETGRSSQWARALANERRGWPQHLHAAMQALAARLLAVSTLGQLEAVDSSFGVAVLRASALARNEYYECRIDDPLADVRQLVAEIFRRIGEGATRGQVLGHIRAAVQPGSDVHSLPEDYDEAMLLDRMVRRGLLQRTPKKMLACPILSFRAYIERTAKCIVPET